MNLADRVRDNFNGMLVIGDVHSDYESLLSAYHHAETHNLFFMSLGDLVDRGPFPFETVSKMSELMKAGKAGLTIGNHDDKFHRFYFGSKVGLSYDSRRTLADVGPDRQQEFLMMYSNIINTPFYSSIFHLFDDIILVHAASHPSMWDSTKKFNSSARSRALYGETNGELHSDGFPVRLYTWIDEIPSEKIVIVGHDRKPIDNVAITCPLVKINSNGGKAIFIDTGCSKGGFLTGVVIKHNKKQFKIDYYVEFK